MNGDTERKLVEAAFASGYVAPCGPFVDALEKETAERFGFAGALATTSGTMALELLARALKIAPGDEVIASDLTFIASVGPFVSLGAKPIFVGCDETTWTMSPALLTEALERHPHAKAVIATDLYGQSCDLDALAEICHTHQVPFICDAAESLGATYKDRSSGKGAWATVYSLNGNKIITSGGGGLLCSDDETLLATCRKYAQQARDPKPWYEHSTLGTHGRLGNIPAAIALGQLRHLDDALRDKARVWYDWHTTFADCPWVTFMPTAPYGTPNHWLTVILLQGLSPLIAVEALAQHAIEARPMWKPMHLQPVFADAPHITTTYETTLFNTGLCLPSGRALTLDTMTHIKQILLTLREHHA